MSCASDCRRIVVAKNGKGEWWRDVKPYIPDDLDLAMEYLNCVFEIRENHKRGSEKVERVYDLLLRHLSYKHVFKYLEKGSDREKEALRALVRLLRHSSDLNRQIRTRLADLFDPDTKSEPRKLVIGSRKRGNKAILSQHYAVARTIALERESGRSMKQALNKVEDIFGVPPGTAKRIWAKRQKANAKQT
jgi:hypothetical protein